METWTEEEAILSTPYSEREEWANILMWELVSGRSRFRGPPGLLAEMESLLSSTTVQEMTSLLLTHPIAIEKTKDGWAVVSTP